MQEQWKIINGFPDYQISTFGNVKTMLDGREVMIKSYPSRPSRGYLWVRFRKDNQRGLAPIHRLVLEHFLGSRPEGMVACHNDGNSLNNHIENLRWDTRKNNMADRIKHGTHRFGERNGKSKLTEQQVRTIKRKYIPRKYGVNQLATEFGVSSVTIWYILRGYRWKHIE